MNIYIVIVNSPEQVQNFLLYRKLLAEDKESIFILVRQNQSKMNLESILQYNDVLNKITDKKIVIVNEKYFLFFKFIIFYFSEKMPNKIFYIIGGPSGFLAKNIIFYKKFNTIILDDGIVTYDLLRYAKLQNYSHLIFFSKYLDFFEEKFSMSIKNDFYSSINLTQFHIEDTSLFVFGGPYVEFGMITMEKYLNLLKKVINAYSIKKLYYFPHRREKFKNLDSLQIETINFFEENRPSFDLIYELRLLAKYSWSINSSMLVDYYLLTNQLKFTYSFSPISLSKIENQRFLKHKISAEDIYEVYLKKGFTEFYD